MLPSFGLTQPSCEIVVGWCFGEVRTQMSVFVPAHSGRPNICFSPRMQSTFQLRSQQTRGGENIEISACNSLGPQAKGSGTLLGWAELCA